MKPTDGKYLVIDCETTGLPPRGEDEVKTTLLPYWPYIVSLAWILFDSKREIIEENYFIILPEDFVIPSKSTEKHGITTSHALEHGVPILKVLPLFLSALSRTSYLIGHKLSYDEEMVKAECLRSNFDFGYYDKIRVCTMERSTDYCRLRADFKDGYKWPKLEELHHRLFRESFEGSHNAMVDARACARCFFALLDRKVIRPEKHNERFTDFVKLIRYLHCDCNEDREWLMPQEAQLPAAPTQLHPRMIAAKAQHSLYRPSFLMRYTGLGFLKRLFLKMAVITARRADQAEYGRLMHEYEIEAAFYMRVKRLKDGEIEEYRKVIDELTSQIQIKGIEFSLKVDIDTPEDAGVNLAFQSMNCIPAKYQAERPNRKSYLRSMGAVMRYQIIRQLVCSLALRLVRELFAHLPLQRIHLTAHLSGKLISEGVEAPVLKFSGTRTQFYNIDWNRREAPEILDSINCQTCFRKIKGFRGLKSAGDGSLPASQ